jgi:hypothetical protein
MTTFSFSANSQSGTSNFIATHFAPAITIATEFMVTPTEIETLHLAGHSYADLMIAYTLARTGGRDVNDLLVRHKSGEGWGRIVGQ